MSPAAMSRDRAGVLRNRGFRNLWLSRWISTFGSEAGGIAILLFLFREQNSLAGLALLVALRMLPAGLAAPLAGVMVDRFDKRKLMIAADLWRALLLFLLILFPLTPNLYLVTIASSIANAFYEPARSASLPAMLAPDELPLANGLDQTMWNLTMVGGPVAGTLLCTRIGLAAALAIDAVSFLAGALFVWATPVPVQPSLPRARSRASSDAKAGLRYLWE